MLDIENSLAYKFQGLTVGGFAEASFPKPLKSSFFMEGGKRAALSFTFGELPEKVGRDWVEALIAPYKKSLRRFYTCGRREGEFTVVAVFSLAKV